MNRMFFCSNLVKLRKIPHLRICNGESMIYPHFPTVDGCKILHHQKDG